MAMIMLRASRKVLMGEFALTRGLKYGPGITRDRFSPRARVACLRALNATSACAPERRCAGAPLRCRAVGLASAQPSAKGTLIRALDAAIEVDFVTEHRRIETINTKDGRRTRGRDPRG